MISPAKLEDYLFNLLNVADFDDFGPNGLQVEGGPEIKKLCAATSASPTVLPIAAEKNADALLVHHGWFWKNENPIIKGAMREKVKLLLDHGISLFGYHLPLDFLPKYGNNEPVLQALECQNIQPIFGCGYVGDFKHPLGYDDYCKKLDDFYGIRGTHLQPAKKEHVKKVAVLSGGGQGYFRKACYFKGRLDLTNQGYLDLFSDLDAYITGESSEWVYPLAHDFSVVYSAMGHNKSEEIGPRLLGRHLAEKFDLDFEFIEDQNPF